MSALGEAGSGFPSGFCKPVAPVLVVKWRLIEGMSRLELPVLLMKQVHSLHMLVLGIKQ